MKGRDRKEGNKRKQEEKGGKRKESQVATGRAKNEGMERYRTGEHKEGKE